MNPGLGTYHWCYGERDVRHKVYVSHFTEFTVLVFARHDGTVVRRDTLETRLPSLTG